MSDPTEFEPGPANLSAFMVRAIGEGLSANQTLAAWREAGGTVDRTFGLKLFGEMRGIGERSSAIAGLDVDVPVPAEMMTPWAANGPGNYAHWVAIHGRYVGERDVSEFRTTIYSDRPLSPAEAQDAAIAELGDVTETGTLAGFEPVGAVVTSVSILTGRPS